MNRSWAAPGVVGGLIVFNLLAWGMLSSPGRSDTGLRPPGPPPTAWNGRPLPPLSTDPNQVFTLRDSNPPPGTDPLETLEDVPFGFVLAALEKMGRNPATAVTSEQAFRMANVVQWMADSDIGGGAFTTAADAILTRPQIDYILQYRDQPVPPGINSSTAAMELLAARAEVRLTGLAARPAGAFRPSGTPPAVPGAEALTQGLLKLERDPRVRLSKEQAAALLPYLKTYVAYKLQVKHAKFTLMNMLDPAQQAFVKKLLTGFDRPGFPLEPARAIDVLALLQGTEGSVEPPQPDPLHLPGMERWNGRVNPLPDDAPTRQSGGRVYRQACAVCHGLEGHGNGPAASALFPKPRSFTEGALHYGDTDGQIMRTVMEGIPHTAMPGYAGRLSTTEGWAVVRYLRSLHAAEH